MNETIKKINVNDFEVVNIGKEIKKVQDYFKNKILNGDYQFNEIDYHVLRISIDGYDFNIWVGNMHIPTTVGIYRNENSFMNIEFTEKEHIKLCNKLKPIVNRHRKEVELKQKEAELDRLRKELDL